MCLFREASTCHLFVTYATLFFFLMAAMICDATFSTGITQNKPSPFAIAVSTSPGRISVTVIIPSL